MGDVLDIGAEWLARQQKRHVAREIRYSRGTSASAVDVRATKGQSRYEVEDGTGRTSITSIDFIVFREDLVLDGEPIDPVTGDRILDGIMQYEVMAISGEPVSRDTDQYRYQHRIHTKLIGTI